MQEAARSWRAGRETRGEKRAMEVARRVRVKTERRTNRFEEEE